MAGSTPKDRVPAAARRMAAHKFDDIPVDPDAFTAERWAERSQADGALNRMLQIVLAEDDEALTARWADATPEEVLDFSETFAEHVEKLEAGVESFRAGTARLLVVAHRIRYGLDRDGKRIKVGAGA